MYTPSSFVQSDPDTLAAFIERYSFATLVSRGDREPVATHLPLLLERNGSYLVRLYGHMARENPQWQDLAGQTVLAIFTGPHAYISPSWYESQNVVPTWNYTAVHVYGTLRLLSAAHARSVLERTVDVYEAPMAEPWRLDSQSADFVARLAGGIVAFEIPIQRVEGKWKLSQNHSPERRRRVIDALQTHPDENSTAVARLMSEMLEG